MKNKAVNQEVKRVKHVDVTPVFCPGRRCFSSGVPTGGTAIFAFVANEDKSAPEWDRSGAVINLPCAELAMFYVLGYNIQKIYINFNSLIIFLK